jgi:3-hydroxyacyl-CoA dehydrogenase
MKLLEIIRHDETSEATFNDAVAYGKSVGKTTVACKDTPGFIVNRMLVPLM